MKRSFDEHTCPEYHFDFGPLGVKRTVPSLPDGTQDFFGQEYFSSYGRIAGAFGQRLSERSADWAELAVAIYIADRFSPRRDPRIRQDLIHRRRKISVRMAVLDLPFWQADKTQELLREALSFVPGDSAAGILAHYEEQAFTLEQALAHEDQWSALANDFPEIYEIEHSITLNGEDEQAVRKSLLQLLRTHVNEWKTFSGREALHRYLVAA